MSKIDDAADQVLGLAERFRGLLDLAEVVKSIGSLDRAIGERQAALETVTQEHSKARSEAGAAMMELDGLRATQARELVQHQEACAALSEKASAESAEIFRQATNDAAALLASTREELSGIRQNHDNAIAEKRATLSALQTKLDDATKALASTTATETATLQRIEALKAAAKSVLGD